MNHEKIISILLEEDWNRLDINLTANFIQNIEKDKIQFFNQYHKHGGWISPNGIFYPSRINGHNDLQDLLEECLNINKNDFEQLFIKMNDDYYEEKFNLKFVNIGKMSPRQKLYIENWVKNYRNEIIKNQNFYDCFYDNHYIDYDYIIRSK